MSKTDFVEWIQRNLDDRGWKRVELTRIGGINSGYVSQVMNREKLPGLDFCKGVARAFDMRDVDVMKIAGLIEDTDQRKYSPVVEAVAAMLNELPEEYQEDFRAMVRAQWERDKQKRLRLGTKR